MATKTTMLSEDVAVTYEPDVLVVGGGGGVGGGARWGEDVGRRAIQLPRQIDVNERRRRLREQNCILSEEDIVRANVDVKG